MRGEYSGGELAAEAVLELPPRARRIPPTMNSCAPWVGTTSACAENTPETMICVTLLRNYLRVRGEYVDIGSQDSNFAELPPRARRILLLT